MSEREPPNPDELEHVRHLKAILEREAMLREMDAKGPPDPRPMLARIPIVAVVGLIFSAVWGNVVRTWTPDPAPQPPAAEARAAHATVLTAGQRVEVFREENGRLPRSLAEAGLGDQPLIYTTDGQEYEIRLAADATEAAAEADIGAPPVFDSETGPEPLIRALAAPVPAASENGP